MSERDDATPFPREPWRRLLEDSADGPPETTDARIRAAARRKLTPRGHRWWLPASLAASFVLAVMIVHTQFGAIRRAPMTQPDRSGGPAMDARLIDRSEAPEKRDAGDAPNARAQRPAPARAPAEAEDHGYLDPETDSDLAVVGPRVGGPEHDLKVASELPEEAQSGSATPPAPAAVTGVTAEGIVHSSSAREAAPLATPPMPEAWYAAIEKLRAEGRIAEAERELARLKEAHPGWLEKHLAKQAPR